jgi:type I restriction enzyme R subunit
MSTGVDAQTCKVIVLDRRIESLSEFKQIIGRGTRINEDYDKYYFTIMDFRKATELFADPDFDGDPVQIYEPKPGDDVVPPEENGGDEMADSESEEVVIPPGVDPIDGGTGGGYRYKFIVSGIPVAVVAERVQYYDKDGKLITESLRDYTKSAVQRQYASLDQFLKAWTEAERKALADDVGKDLDAFDLVCHVAWGQPPLTRRERAQNVKKRNYFAKYGGKARAVLEALLTKYADEGVENIESMDVLRVHPVSQLGTPVEIIAAFGGKEEYLSALRELEVELYKAA